MPEFQHAADDKKCLYRYESGVIQLNVERLGQNSSSKAPWAVLTTESTDSGENAQQHPTLIRSQITCALHPTLSGNDGLPWTLNRLRMEYTKGVEIVSPESQLCISSAIIFCNLPHLYPTARGSSSAELEISWGAYDAIITLIQTHFRYCKDIMLVLWADPDISFSKRDAEQERDAMVARLEKVLYRADELYRTLAQQGCEFSIFPSPRPFELCLAQAKETGGVFEEGDWDRNRGAESRVWRSVDPNTLKNESSSSTGMDGKPGYWIRTSFFDWFERKDMQNVGIAALDANSATPQALTAGSTSLRPSEGVAAQACENGNKTAQTLGVFADATGNLASVLNALRVWNKGLCLTGADNQQVWSNTPINVLKRHAAVKSDNTTIAARFKTKLLPRDTCTYVQAIANDGCWSLAQRCNITQAELRQYNSDRNFCNNITVGEYVCCSPGSLPGFSP
ncbi:hypothetical protein CNMCM8927_002563 [Aspergillus lentulus]|uniref:LysM domain-containing protein n=1 Tax=Aspergillus lentulus TaxID=293939 RepID=A0AAN6BLA4_ASPLE|nr:hypothetical protein CNMCM8927_002563 [Aspergillus lentulus]